MNVAITSRPWGFKRSHAAAAALLLVAGLSGAARAAGNSSKVTPLPQVNGKPAFPIAISHNGQFAAGEFDFGTRDASNQQVYKAFKLVNGAVVPIQVPGYNDPGLTSYGEGVNDSGDVVGEFIPPGGTYPFAFYAHGTQVTNLNDVLGATFSQARAINNSGVVVGFAVFTDGSYGGFVYNTGSQTVIRIPNAYPSAINSAGHVVGMTRDSNTHAVSPFFYAGSNNNAAFDPAALHSLGTLGGTDTLQYGPSRINDSDVIVGAEVGPDSLPHAVKWAGGAAGQTAVSIEPSGTHPNGSQAFGINNSGAVVGIVDSEATYWPATGTPQSLNTIVQGGLTPSYQVGDALAISDDAQVAASVASTQSGISGGAIIALAASTTSPQLSTLSITPTTVDGSKDVTGSVGFTAPLTSTQTVQLVVYAGSTVSTQPFASVNITLKHTTNPKVFSFTYPAAQVKQLLQSLPHGVTQLTAVVTGNLLGQTNPVTLTIGSGSTALHLTGLVITPKVITGTQPLSIKITFSQVVPTGTVVTLKFYAGSGTAGPLVQYFTVTQNSTSSTNKTYTAVVPVTSLHTLLLALQQRQPGATTMTAQVEGDGGLGKTNSVLLHVHVSTPLAALQVASASITPSFSKSTPPKSIKLSLTFNRPLGTTEKSVNLHATVSVRGVGDVPFDFTVKRTSTTAVDYTVTADKLSVFSQLLSNSSTPTGTYRGTVAVKAADGTIGTPQPFSFTLNP